MFGVILAGGIGSRFWPYSRAQDPKQLQRIVGAGTMIQNTVERLIPLVPVNRLYVVGNDRHAIETCKQLSGFGFPASHLIAEPVGHNTAAAIGLAARFLSETDPEAVMGIFPADHVVTDPKPFLEALSRAQAAAGKDHLVTLGIRPTRPETGYGYIQKGAGLDNGAYRVERFVEKPQAVAAKQFIEQGNYFWNCGVFVAKVSVVLEEIKTHLPKLRAALDPIVAHIQEKTGRYPYRAFDAEAVRTYESLASVSFDHGVLEHSARVAVIPAEFFWSDIGAWNALDEVMDKDPDGNLVAAENVVTIDCSETLFCGNDRLIAGLGLKNLIVVDSPDALLVCDKNRAQDVKILVDKLQQQQRPEAAAGVTVQKPWGSYPVLENGKKYRVKRIEVLPGEKLSLQSHDHRSEHWTVVSGEAEIQLEDKTCKLGASDSILIPQKAIHRLGNRGRELLILIEVQTGETLSEDDITRHEDLYGR